MKSISEIEAEFYKFYLVEFHTGTKVCNFFHAHLEERDKQIAKLQTKLAEAEMALENNDIAKDYLPAQREVLLQNKFAEAEKRIEFLEAMEKQVMDLTHPNFKFLQDELTEEKKKYDTLQTLWSQDDMDFTQQEIKMYELEVKLTAANELLEKAELALEPFSTLEHDHSGLDCNDSCYIREAKQVLTEIREARK